MGSTKAQEQSKGTEQSTTSAQDKAGAATGTGAPQARAAWQSYVRDVGSATVQAKGSQDLPSGHAQQTAHDGVRGSGGALPHQDRIQASFGRHDVGNVQAHVGGAAAQASDTLGAEAYAIGNSVGFRSDPGLHTSAHEAAHVVQQRAGVQLKGGVGQAGDVYEKHADAVADRVVAGESAESLLDETARGAAASGTSTAVQKQEKLPKGDKGFEQMWDAHPHNTSDLEADEENTASGDLLEDLGLPDGWNTCAIRLSVMLNGIGLTITPAKVKAAGIKRRPMYSREKKQYLILAAAEMWQYLEKNFRAADLIVPAQGAYQDANAYDVGFKKDIEPAIAGRKGIVAFDKIFGYSGTGHVDLFDGEKLSDSDDWYASKRVRLWFIDVP